MSDDTSHPEETNPRCDGPKIQDLISALRPHDPSLPGVPLADAFQRFVKLMIRHEYERGNIDPNADGDWADYRVFEIATQLAFLNLLKNGTLQAFGQNGSLEWNPPLGYWTFIEVKDIDFERSVFFPSDPARTVYGVMIAPPADAPKKKPGPKSTIKDEIASKMQQYAKEHGPDALRAIKVALLPVEFGGSQTTAYEACKFVLSKLSDSLKG